MFTRPLHAGAGRRFGMVMDTSDRVQKLLYEAVDEVNLGLSEGERLEKSPEVVLVGESGRLDSLGLVNFIVAAERRLQSEFQTALSLTEMLTSQEASRFRTLGALCTTVTGMVEARRGGS